MNSGGSAEVAQALSLHALSRDPSLSATTRFLALEACFRCFERLCEQESSHLRLASLARAARDYGARSIAVNALTQLCTTILQQQQVDASEPFLAG